MPDILYENQTLGTGGHDSIFSDWWKFQTFTPSISHQITSVDLYLHRTGSPGTILVEIYGVDGSSKPDVGGGVLASGSYDSSVLTDDGVAQWLNILVSGAGDELGASTEYALVHRLQNTGASGSVSNHYENGNPYAGGISGRSTDGGSSFTTDVTVDTTFKEYGLLPPSTKTLTADASISQDSLLKTLTADVNLVEPKKTLTVDASISQDALLKTLTVDVGIDIEQVVTWPESRTAVYDPDKLWDEETKSWYEPDSSIGSERMVQAGGRYRSQIVVLSNQGKIYFGAS